MSQTNGEAIADGHRLLMECSLFEPLDEAVRRQLAARARRVRRRAGDVIFEMGSEGESMMAVLSGAVRISIPSPQGKEIILADLPAGEFFGEMALLDSCGRSADATALTDCTLLVLNRRDVLPILRRHPDVCFSLFRVICGRLREAHARLTDILFSSASVRLAKILLRDTAARRHAVKSDAVLKVACSQRELGDMTGVRRERVNHCLRDWERRGMIQRKAGWIVILKPWMLEQVVQRG
jgi:CRP/FNR family transcriptional regulator, cyclic AMP receptor protein